jgi:hypothetical protein
VIISDASFLEMLFYGISHSEFLVLTHIIPGMTEKSATLCGIFQMHSIGKLPILVITISTMMVL